MSGSNFGIIGLGTMGRNLALNIESHGYRVAVWNLETEWIGDFISQHPGAKFEGTPTFEAFTAALSRPRRIMMMIPAGKPVDATIEKLQPLLERGDIAFANALRDDRDVPRAEAGVLGGSFERCPAGHTRFLAIRAIGNDRSKALVRRRGDVLHGDLRGYRNIGRKRLNRHGRPRFLPSYSESIGILM